MNQASLSSRLPSRIAIRFHCYWLVYCTVWRETQWDGRIRRFPWIRGETTVWPFFSEALASSAVIKFNSKKPALVRMSAVKPADPRCPFDQPCSTTITAEFLLRRSPPRRVLVFSVGFSSYFLSPFRRRPSSVSSVLQWVPLLLSVLVALTPTFLNSPTSAYEANVPPRAPQQNRRPPPGVAQGRPPPSAFCFSFMFGSWAVGIGVF